MKRFVLAGMLMGLWAGTAAAQSTPYGSIESSRPSPSRVILKGVSSAEPVIPAAATAAITPSVTTQDKAAEGAELAKCDKCGHDWTDCTCSDHCGGWTVFGEWLYLEPKGYDPVFALRGPVCTGGAFPPTGSEQIDFGAHSGYKVGIGKALHDGCSEIVGTFWHLEANDGAETGATPPTVLLPILVFDPFLNCDTSTTTNADASASIILRRAEIDYRRHFYYGCNKLDWLVGFAYGELGMDLNVRYGGADQRIVDVESDAYGYGFRVGGGIERGAGCFRAFGHIDLTLLNMNMNASYEHLEPAGVAPVVADVDHELDRIVPILDLQLGVAFDLTCHTVIKVGYLYSIWFNVVTPTEFVEDVQHLDFSGSGGDVLTFDGLFARVEITW